MVSAGAANRGEEEQWLVLGLLIVGLNVSIDNPLGNASLTLCLGLESTRAYSATRFTQPNMQ